MCTFSYSSCTFGKHLTVLFTFQREFFTFFLSLSLSLWSVVVVGYYSVFPNSKVDYVRIGVGVVLDKECIYLHKEKTKRYFNELAHFETDEKGDGGECELKAFNKV